MSKSPFGQISDFLDYFQSSVFLSLVLVIGMAVPCVQTYGQVDGRRIYQEQLRVRLDQLRPSAREVGFDTGGWLNFAYFTYSDAENQQHRLRQYEARVWASLNIKDVHKFYVRGLWGYNDWNAGDNPKGYVNDEDIDPELERAWYEFDLGQMLQNQTGVRPDVEVKVKVGRAFANIGTSLVLSLPLDMIQFDVEAGNWALMALLGRTVDDTPNIDTSTPVATDQDRCFWGLELAYTGFDRHRPFVYFLANNDNTSARPKQADQRFEYNSRYVGIGSQGTVLLPNLRYQVELVGEWGKAYSEGATSGRDKICAMALDVLLEYLIEAKTHPKLMVEYLFASGDDDRSSSSTSTVGGNLEGTKDRAFNAFGFRDTGITFAPAISNMNIYIAGASFSPLEDHKLFEKMELGTKVFFYHKTKSGGPISDTTADTSEQWVGWEWDAYCDWRVTSDLTWTVRYGAFQPGAAFENSDCRYFLFTGVTFSF